MRLAAVDIGNTTVKITLFDGERVVGTHRVQSVPEAVEQVAKMDRPEVAWCTTRDMPEGILAELDRMGWWQLKPSGERLPLRVDYDTPLTLGADRIAGTVGAAALYGDRNLMVADAGTALTIDVVLKGGIFMGGNISAGVGMRLRALHEFTSKLPLVASEDDPVAFGRDTASALRRGALWGVAWEIAGAYVALGKEYQGDLCLVLTGGDLQLLAGAVEKAMPWGAEIKTQTDLVAYGLKKAYEYNHDE